MTHNLRFLDEVQVEKIFISSFTKVEFRKEKNERLSFFFKQRNEQIKNYHFFVK